MNIGEEIAQALDGLLVDSYDSPSSETLAAAVMPLVKRAQAEAWSQGHAHGEFYADDPIAFQDNPYAAENEGERA